MRYLGEWAGDERRVWDDQVRDEDDRDLLTFAESGIRLRGEISLAEAELRQCPGRGAAGRAAGTAERPDGGSPVAPGMRRRSRGKRFLDYAPPTVGHGRPQPHDPSSIG